MRVARVEFLPLGWDSASSSWRVEADEAVYFLKIRKGPLNPASVLVPRHLSEQGFQQVIGPVLSTNGAAWTTVTLWPATVSVPRREPAFAFWETLNLTMPFPLPFASEVMVINASSLAAVQAQPSPALTLITPSPAWLEKA